MVKINSKNRVKGWLAIPAVERMMMMMMMAGSIAAWLMSKIPGLCCPGQGLSLP